MRPLAALLATLAAVGLGAAVARRWFDAVEVVGSSMAPTLLPGDRLLVESLTLGRRAPRPGEVVLAPDPRTPHRELVKRVEAVDPASGQVVLQGDADGASTDSRTFGPLDGVVVRWRAALRYWPPGRFGVL